MKVALLQTDFNTTTNKYLKRVVDLHESLKIAAKPQSLGGGGTDVLTKESPKSIQNSIAKYEQIHKEFLNTYVGLEIPPERISAESLHAKGYDDWLWLTKKELRRTYSKLDKGAYENFVQGYLAYWELNINKKENDPPKPEYTIYFDWGKTRKNCALVIYIKPGLETKLYNENGLIPPPPSMTDPIKPPPPPPPTQR